MNGRRAIHLRTARGLACVQRRLVMVGAPRSLAAWDLGAFFNAEDHPALVSAQLLPAFRPAPGPLPQLLVLQSRDLEIRTLIANRLSTHRRTDGASTVHVRPFLE